MVRAKIRNVEVACATVDDACALVDRYGIPSPQEARIMSDAYDRLLVQYEQLHQDHLALLARWQGLAKAARLLIAWSGRVAGHYRIDLDGPLWKGLGDAQLAVMEALEPILFRGSRQEFTAPPTPIADASWASDFTTRGERDADERRAT